MTLQIGVFVSAVLLPALAFLTLSTLVHSVLRLRDYLERLPR